jgi:hypothetical protein
MKMKPRFKIDLEDAINILKTHQGWRLGGEGEMIYPKELTQAIDIVINEFTLIKKEMTAKEKSEHLIRQMTVDFNIDYQQSVLCAMICCDEVLEALQLHDIVMIDYWDRVKIELMKL